MKNLITWHMSTFFKNGCVLCEFYQMGYNVDNLMMKSHKAVMIFCISS